MCTAVLSVEPGQPVLLAGVRDELTDRAWEPPGRHWPQFPGLIGGRDLLAGGTWLAVCDQERRVGCVLNAIGKRPRRRPGGRAAACRLAAAAGQPLDRDGLADVDPFHLLTAEPGRAIIQSWDGCELTERTLQPGLHFVVNSGLASDLAGGRPSPASAAGTPNGREHELARIAHFLARFRSAARPDPRPGQAVADCLGVLVSARQRRRHRTGRPAGADRPPRPRRRPDLGDDLPLAGQPDPGRGPLRLHRQARRCCLVVSGALSLPQPLSPSTWRRPGLP